MPGAYKCKNCGHIDYYYGSPLWVQKCKKCHKPIGLKQQNKPKDKQKMKGSLACLDEKEVNNV